MYFYPTFCKFVFYLDIDLSLKEASQIQTNPSTGQHHIKYWVKYTALNSHSEGNEPGADAQSRRFVLIFLVRSTYTHTNLIDQSWRMDRSINLKKRGKDENRRKINDMDTE